MKLGKWTGFLMCVFFRPVSAANLPDLINHLESVPSAEAYVYQLKDDQDRAMDCLKILSTTQGQYMGISHSFKDGIFSVRLSHSKNLIDWQFLGVLDQHASQPNIWLTENGAYIVAYEKDTPNSCWIRLRFYPDLTHLRRAEFSAERDIQRALALTAEGTPSFESVKLVNNQLNQSEIHLRFHYYKRAKVDRLAEGQLINFCCWKAKPLDAINRQEVQKKLYDWSSWRIALCDADGMPLKELSIETHHGSSSYANPNISWIKNEKGEKKLVVTLFLPYEGNSPKEAGPLLYIVSPSKPFKAIP